MDKALDNIRLQIGAENLADTCSRDGCEVSLTDVPRDRIIVDADLAFPAHGDTGERCDFIVFIISSDRNLLGAPVELKSGNKYLAKTVRQLRNGAQFVDRYAPKNPSSICRPILIHGSRISSKDRRRLNRLKVPFRGLDLTIKTAHCGLPGNLAFALK